MIKITMLKRVCEDCNVFDFEWMASIEHLPCRKFSRRREVGVVR